MTLLLGIDVGTSSTKALLYDPASHTVVATAGREYLIHQPGPDHAEQDPDAWWYATIHTVRTVLAGSNPQDVVGIGFSGQMHGTVLLDENCSPVHPAIIWADQRSREATQKLVERVGEQRLLALTGTLPATGFMGPTLLWLATHAPELAARTHWAVLPKDYVRLRLTREVATDKTDAAGTGLFDIAKGQWAEEVLREVGLPTTLLPPVLASNDIAGRLTEKAAEALGLPSGIPVVTGCADQAAQAVGNGVIAPGKGSVTIGSGGQVLLPLVPQEAGIPTDPRLHVFNHAVPGTFYVLGAILSAGLSLRWLRSIVGLDGTEDGYKQLSSEAAQVPPGASGLLFLPYLLGERAPHMDPLARGLFFGLGHYHERGHLARAIMEGVAFALRDTLELALALAGPVDIMVAAGGGAESDVWLQIQADLFGKPLRRSLVTEQAALGAALLAGVGVGYYRDLNEACEQAVKYGEIIEPEAQTHAHYNDLYGMYVQLYPHLRDNMHLLAHHAEATTRHESSG